MRKATILMAVVALMVALVAGSAAAKQGGKNMATYNFKGTIEEVGADGDYRHLSRESPPLKFRG